MSINNSPIVISVVSRSEKMIDDEICYMAAECLAGREIRAKMHASKNST